jgi:hypothetical protein
MRKSLLQIFLLCGLVFTFAAFPLFAQENESRSAVAINKKPLQDLSSYVKDGIEKNGVNLSQPFKVVLDGALTESGTLDRQKSRYVLSEGDPQMIDVAKRSIEAAGDSGWFGYLRSLGGEKIKITLSQDENTVTGFIESEQATEAKAQTLVSAVNTMLSATKIALASRKEGKSLEREKTILNGVQKASAGGTTFRLDFALPKQTVQDMIIHSLMRRTAKISGSE